MADATINLKVLLESVGIKASTKKIEQLRKTLDSTTAKTGALSEGLNKTKRNLDGVSQRTGSTNKDFGRMAQGMGGLVQAYATVAANVFALSSAFLVLRNAADLSSMQKSARDFSVKFGRDVIAITKNIKEATGGAINLADALPSINRAIGSGIGVKAIEELAVAATKASQTFGGSANEALNRFISAAQRGRVEIVQTLGIVVNTEKAYAKYAASVGKVTKELTGLDKTRAIVSAISEESLNVFEDVNIDPNPFTQLLNTVIDLKDTIATFSTDRLTPLLNIFNQSKAAAAALIALIAGSVTSRIFPEIANQVNAARAKGAESSRIAAADAAKARIKRDARISNSFKIIGSKRRRQLKTETQNFNDELNKRAIKHKAFAKSIIDDNGKMNTAAIVAQRAAIARELKARKTGTGAQAAFAGADTRHLEAQYTRLVVVSNGARVSQNALAVAAANTTTTFRTQGLVIASWAATTKAAISSAVSIYKSSFAQGFSATQRSFVDGLKLTGIRFSKLFDSFRAESSRKTLPTLFKAGGTAVGLLGGALTKLIGAFTQLTVIISIGIFIYQKFGDTLRGISKEERQVIDATKKLNESFEGMNKIVAEVLVKLDKRGIQTLKRFADGVQAASGAFASASDNIRSFQSDVVAALGGFSVTEAVIELKKLEAQIDAITEKEVISLEVIGGRVLTPVSSLSNSEIDSRRKLQSEANETKKIISRINKDINKDIILSNVRIQKQLASAVGFESYKNQLKEVARESKELNKELGILGNTVFTDLIVDRLTGTSEEVSGVLKVLEEQVKSSTVGTILLDLLATVSDINAEASTVFVTSIKNLKQIDTDLQTYVSGLEKASSVSGVNKDLINFLIGIDNELKAIEKVQTNNPNALIDSKLASSGELTLIKEFLDITESIKDTPGFIGAARQAVERLRVTYVELASELIKLKGIITVNNIALKNNASVIISSDKDRIEQLKERLRIERSTLQATLSITKKEIAAQREKVKFTAKANKGTTALKKEQDTLRTLIATGDQQKLQIVRLEDQKKLNLLNLDIIKEVLTVQKELAGIETGGLAIIKTFTRSFEQRLRVDKAILANKFEQLEVDRRLLEAQRARLQADSENKDLNARRIETINARLTLLDLENEKLKRNNDLIIRARELEAQGLDFTPEGARVVGQVFVEELQKGVTGLKSTIETLGIGFANTLSSTIDSSVQNLLETGSFSKFGRNLKESLKEGLREAFGTALSDRIKKDIAGIFNLPGNAQEQALQAQIEATSEIFNNTVALQELTRTIASFPVTGLPGEGTKSILPTTTTDDVTKITTSPTTNTLADAIKEGGSKTRDALANSTIVSEEILAENKKGFTGMIGGIFKLISGLVGGAGSTGSSIFGALFTALSGGIGGGAGSTGSTGSASTVKGFGLRKLASGGLTNGPEIALIGEGRNREAVVPLPNNKEIPVNLNGSGSGDVTISQSFDFSNSDESTINKLRGEARAIEDRTFNRVFSEISKGGKFAKIVGAR